MATNYGWRGTVARLLGFLVAYIIAHAEGEAFEVLRRTVVGLDPDFVRISIILLKLPVALGYVYLVWRIYPLYMRFLVRVGWLKERKQRRERSEEE